MAHPPVLLDYVKIPAGSFVMGCVSGDVDCDSDEAPHQVTISHSFWLGRTEVSVEAYRQFAQARGRPAPGGETGHPVVRVSWDDAVEFCDWAGGRLPTEAEWEYAARGGRSGLVFPWGNTFERGSANLKGTGGRDQWDETAPGGSFPPNAFGLHDMAGNVWEWCSDWYGKGYYATSPATDPRGPAAGTDRVVRGGGWGSAPTDMRASFRGRYTPGSRFVTYGFRCARDTAP